VLQAPIAFFSALVASLVVVPRVVFFSPEVTVEFGDRARELGVPSASLPTDVAIGGWLGLLALILLVVGSWISTADERKNTAAAHARTEALLGAIPVRPAPPVGTNPTPETEADAVAQDEVPDVASEPATDDAPSTGESA
jgi:hypothetical protein